MRLLLLCLMFLGYCGCTMVRSLPVSGHAPETVIVVYDDGFHSGIALEESSLSTPWHADGTRAGPLLGFQFGEEGWLIGSNKTCGHVCCLGMTGGNGVVILDRVAAIRDIPGEESDAVREWRFPARKQAIAAIEARLRQYWVKDNAILVPNNGPKPWCLYQSPKEWRARENCHDFTFDLLRVAGLGLDNGGVLTSSDVRKALDEATQRMRELGITAL